MKNRLFIIAAIIGIIILVQLLVISNNTNGNDKCPFIHSDGRTLYFSSAERLDAVTFCISNCVCFKPSASSGASFAGAAGL